MLTPDRFPFLDVTGSLRHARSLSLLDRKYFLQLRDLALKLAANADLRVLYDGCQEFSELINACLLMSGISPAWVDAGMACRMLFGLGDEPPLLMSLNFPDRPPSDDSTVIPDEYDLEAYSVASLWSATNDLESALRIAKAQPWTLVSEVLRARAHQIKKSDPKEQEKEQVKQAEDRFSALAQSGKLDKVLERFNNAGS